MAVAGRAVSTPESVTETDPDSGRDANQRRTPGSAIPRPGPFWAGVALTSAGIAYHIWMFARAAPMHFQLATMPMTPSMWIAMAAIVFGVVLSGFALRHGRSAVAGDRCPVAAVSTRSGNRRLIGVLSFALLLDQLKPATVAFIEPGMRLEYHLTRTEISWLPTVALTGTVVGSLVWGRAADRIGRRATILTASLLFLGTTVCGAMTSFAGNLIMCGLMGMAAGGMLPVVYALLTECLPARRRGAIMVLQAGLTTTGGYMIASGLAALLLPLAGWRVLWFAQLPLAIALIALNRSIPESAAFNARADGTSRALVPATAILARPHLRHTLLVSAYALSWGLVYWGFATFLPSLLTARGGMSAATLLFMSSVLAVPACAVASWLYTRWSTKRTMAVYAWTTAIGLVALAVIGRDGGRIPTLIAVMTLLVGASGMIALLGPYTATAYPARLRGTGGGVVAAVSKSGGAFGPPLIATLLGLAGGVRTTALLVALPVAAAAVAIALSRAEKSHASSADAGADSVIAPG
jgi:putative MFS transporter